MDNQQQQSTAVAIFQPQNVQAIAQMGPEAYNRNTASHDACLKAGQALLAQIQQQGMTDDLDQQAAKFIDKAKITLKNMNGRRSPVTQLFDQLRKAYTALENDIDPAKADTIPAQIQAARNAYAAQKREQAERIRRQEAARQYLEQARIRYAKDVEDCYMAKLNALITTQINALTTLDTSTTLDNFDVTAAALKEFSPRLSRMWQPACDALVPQGLAPDECRRIQQQVLASKIDSFCEQYEYEIEGYRDEIIDRLPSKRAELERMAKASAAEAERIRQEMAQREAEEAQRKLAQRLERERQEKAAAELAAQKNEMDGLFGAPAPATPATYQPKASVKKCVAPQSPDDIMAIVAYWWSQEGQAMPLDELAKMFKRQITYANKAANAACPAFIKGIAYVDEVKAK